MRSNSTYSYKSLSDTILEEMIEGKEIAGGSKYLLHNMMIMSLDNGNPDFCINHYSKLFCYSLETVKRNLNFLIKNKFIDVIHGPTGTKYFINHPYFEQKYRRYKSVLEHSIHRFRLQTR